jgi:hypothetical protein
VHLGRFWPAQPGLGCPPPSKTGEVGEPWLLAHGRRWRRSIPVTGDERGWGKWPRCMPTARGLILGGGNWHVAQREVWSTGGARGGVSMAVPWPEVPVHVEVLLGGNGGAAWLAVGSEQRPTVQGGAWRQWEAHRLRGEPERWLVEAVVIEVAMEEVAGDVGGGLALRSDTNKKQHCEGEEEKQVDLASSTTSGRG